MKLPILFTACSVLALTACGGGTVKDVLGVGRKAPDEFRVVSRPPLSVPPQFNLRPPSSGAASPIVVPADKQAEAIVTGNSVQINNGGINDGGIGNVDTAVTPVESSPLDSPASRKDGKRSSGESQFLKNIGVDKADPKVRDELIQQKIAAQEKKEEASWWDVFSSTPEKKETLVDAKAESKRIQTNKAENKPITEGKTPEVKDKDRGLIGNIFGW